ncbi:MAG TPA: TIGR03936 family radical SAM-associated protein [Candidatus Acidoferrum sp.]|nr:TIGR03936 family radical SAM-associated protein [Candidatus Acidoferrum sp.]
MQGVRLFFAKRGRGVYISHLDMVRAVARGLSRAGIRVKYTEGFNPIPYLVFGQPLSLGYAGLREVCDFSILADDMPVESVAPALADVMPEVVFPTLSVPPVNKLGAVTMADYVLCLKSGRPVTREEVMAALSKPEIVVLKKTKRGEAMTDIAPLIFELYVPEDMTVRCRLACSSAQSLNPSYLIKVLNDAYPDAGIGWLSVTRERFLLPGGADFS